MRFVTESDAWKGLANAIILQACEDYPAYGAANFFKSEWFMFLSRHCVEGETVLKFLESGGFEHGKKLHKEKII